jgi:MFS family permease
MGTVIADAATRSGARFRPVSLDAINFLLADVRGALGPYLNVFLVTQQHWSQSEVGLVTTIGGLLGLSVQTPIGGAIDATRAKRGAIVVALAILGLGAIVIFAMPKFWLLAIANSLMAVVGDVFGPAVAALTLRLLHATAARSAHGTKLGFRPRRQRRHRPGGGRGWLCIFAARGVSSGPRVRLARGHGGAFYSRRGH